MAELTLTPVPAKDIRLVPVRSEDLCLLQHWLCRPHVVRWWGDPDQALASVKRHSPTEHAVISVDRRPVGYVCWQRPSSSELALAGLSSLPTDHVDVDILIGEPHYLGRGIGPVALKMVVDRLRPGGVSSVGVGTDAEHARAHRAFEKAGFELHAEFSEQGRAMCYLIRRLRTAT